MHKKAYAIFLGIPASLLFALVLDTLGYDKAARHFVIPFVCIFLGAGFIGTYLTGHRSDAGIRVTGFGVVSARRLPWVYWAALLIGVVFSGLLPLTCGILLLLGLL